jgi:hypothetical protein
VPETRTRTSSGRRTTAVKPPSAAAAAGAGAEGDGARPLVCNVAFCPICMAVTAAQGAAPDAVEHLLKAARELFLAARAVIDERADHLEGTGRPRVDLLEKIEIA